MKSFLFVAVLLAALAFATVPVLVLVSAAVASHPHNDCKKNCQHKHPESPPP